MMAFFPNTNRELHGLYFSLESGGWLFSRLNVTKEKFLQSGVELVELTAHDPEVVPMVLHAVGWW